MENNNEKKIKLTFNKKVISISFLALALFMLLAVSYAYFTATVTGNDKARKTTVTTGTMAVKLTGPTEVTTKENMVPGDSVSIEFSVENTGTVATYYNLDMIDVENTFVDKSDLVYSVKSDKGANKENTVAPSDKGTLIPNIRIEKGDTHSYTLTITFLETHSNQNSNQGKTFSGKVQISNIEGDTLAAAILTTNPLQTEEINFRIPSPYHNAYCAEYGYDGCIDYRDETNLNSTGLNATEDDDGTSYYFRGAKDKLDNNVKFANMDWKIIRINGDGTIRIMATEAISESNIEFNPTGDTGENAKYVGYTYDTEESCTNEHPCESDYKNSSYVKNYTGTDSNIKSELEKWYTTNIGTKGYDDKVALTRFCNDSSIDSGSSNAFNYKSYHRMEYNNSTPILTCPDPTDLNNIQTHNFGGVYKLKVGLITADEAAFAGIGGGSYGGSVSADQNYLDFVSDYSITMTPERSDSPWDFIMFNFNSGIFYDGPAKTSGLAYPVINLKADVTFTGDGTASKPYTVSS